MIFQPIVGGGNDKSYVTGSYSGNNGSQFIELGFRPSFVIISGSKMSYPTGISYFGAYDVFTGGTILTQFISFTNTGFTVTYTADNEYPQLSQSGRLYNYIAFK